MKFYLQLPDKDIDITHYKTYCNLMLTQFRQMLKDNIPNALLNTRQTQLNRCTVIRKYTNGTINIKTVIDDIVNNMRCYEDLSNTCYYSLPPTLLCRGTYNTLEEVSRILEFGTQTVSPLHWIKRTWNQFYVLCVENWKLQVDRRG